MSRPNVLLFFTDQQRFDTIAALGNGVIRTPNLDRLCAEGTAFTSAYSPSPVCVSARCSLHYGQYPWRTGCYDNGYDMPTDRPSFMDVLTEAGYRTHGIGKCHFTPDGHALRGFQSRETQEECTIRNDDYVAHLHANGFEHVSDPHGARGQMYYTPQLAQMPARLHPTQWIGDRSVAFVEQQADANEPWMLFSSFIHPHPPFAPPVPWNKLYRVGSMPLPKLPADFESLHTYINRRQNRYKYRDRGLDMNLIRLIRAHYYACISFIDFQIGRMLSALEESGQLDDTLILFTSDHGEYLGDYQCFGKRGMHDSAARIPLIARMPGRFDGGQIVDEPANLVDIAPTILQTTGCKIADHELDGADLRAVASGDADRAGGISQFNSGPNGVYMLAAKRWKYIYSAPDDKELLFDAVEDPLETRNKATAPFMSGVRDEMKTALIAALRAGGEEAALDGDDWRRYPVQTMPDDPDDGLLTQDPAWAELGIEGYGDGRKPV